MIQYDYNIGLFYVIGPYLPLPCYNLVEVSFFSVLSLNTHFLKENLSVG